MAGNETTNELYQRARRVMPGRQSNFRDVPGTAPFFLSSADQLTYIDADGKEFTDFTISMGAAIWGYGDQEYKDAVIAQIDTLLAMSSGAAQSELEVELAEAIVDRVPGAEWVRFGISGTEAVQLAIRLCRAHTKRPLFVRFAGHYHGWMDNVAGGSLPDGSDPPFPVHSDDDPGATDGRCAHAFEESLILPWNDADALEDLLRRHSSKVAVIVMEAIMCNNGCCPPRPGYLKRVRELCDQYGCLLMFDEVITGFRVAPGGAQDLLGITPDIATFGKALAGGLPLSAVVGRKEILQQLRDNTVLGGGTFNAFQLGMAAGVATMRKFAANNWAAYDNIDELQSRLNDGLRTCAQKHQLPLLIQGPRGVTYIQFIDRDVAWAPSDLAGADGEKSVRFKGLLMDNGILMAGGNRWFLSPNHSETDIDRAITAADAAMAQL